MMVECEHGMEERSLGGQVNLARSATQSPGAAQGSSYFNREEAVLAVRHVSLPSTQLTEAHGRQKHLCTAPLVCITRVLGHARGLNSLHRAPDSAGDTFLMQGHCARVGPLKGKSVRIWKPYRVVVHAGPWWR